MRSNPRLRSVAARSSSLAWSAALALGTVLVASPAAAIVIDANVQRADQRPTAEDPFTISYSDCAESNQFSFTISSVQVGDTLSVWATVSADCTDLQTRNEGLCTRIVEPFQLSDIAVTLEVPSTDIANTLENVNDCMDSGATDAPRPVKLYFLINETADPVTESSTYDTYVDLLGPPAPTDVSVGVGDQDKLTVSYTAPTSSTDVEGYYFYCEVAGDPVATGGSGAGAGGSTATGGSGGLSGGGGIGGATGGAGGAGATGAGAAGAGASGAGASGAGGGSGDCTAPTLVPGELPPAGLAACGETTSLTGGLAEGLALGVEYAVAVAGYDKVGNVGKLSALACGIPEPVDDFFEIYRKAGGEAGGGYCGHCALPATGRQSAVGVGIGLLVGLTFLGRRSRRGSRRTPS